tara:strand:+ start:459 stop:698 length:240 start_codon:yes stop_codon:yes gene_type:complete
MAKRPTNSVECRLNKQVYPTKKAAQKAKERQSLTKQRSLRIYYCNNCAGYHLTKDGGKPTEKPIIHFDLATGKIYHEKD